jgi:glycosyltransferase involved in cell wall biosynthesis
MNKRYPKISVVTANYNGAKYLERTMQSVINQKYPEIEYIVIDGGSTDGSQKIIEKYEKHLAYWESRKDRGFAHAYNKGFAKSTGDILAYINSDDLYCPWAFEIVARCFSDIAALKWLTSLCPVLHSEECGFIDINVCQPYNRRLYYAGCYGRILQFVQQESTFWSRELWQKAGGYLDESLEFAIDAELWARFFQSAELYAVRTAIGGFRYRLDSKTGLNLNRYFDEMAGVLKRYKRDAAEIAMHMKYDRKYLGFLKLWKGRTRYYGKVVKWDLTSGRYVAQDGEIGFGKKDEVDS